MTCGSIHAVASDTGAHGSSATADLVRDRLDSWARDVRDKPRTVSDRMINTDPPWASVKGSVGERCDSANSDGAWDFLHQLSMETDLAVPSGHLRCRPVEEGQ
jgi:hypothetical protein